MKIVYCNYYNAKDKTITLRHTQTLDFVMPIKNQTIKCTIACALLNTRILNNNKINL